MCKNGSSYSNDGCMQEKVAKFYYLLPCLFIYKCACMYLSTLYTLSSCISGQMTDFHTPIFLFH